MTRINTIDVEDLLDQHLMAEYRELPMIAGSLHKSLNSKRGVVGIPDEFTLNAGHVKFFYNKKPYLRDRYRKLILELVSRGYQLDPDRRPDFDVFDNIPNVKWQPTIQDHRTLVNRIIERVTSKPDFYRLKGEPVDINEYIKYLKEKY